MSTTIKILCANNAVGKLSTAISSTTTEMVLSGSEGSYFPNAVAGASAFYATLEDTSGNIETVLVTSKNNNTFTITRAQGGTSARAWPINTEVSNRVTAELLEDKMSRKEHAADMATKLDKSGGSMTGGLTFSSSASIIASSGNASITAASGSSTSTLLLKPDGTAQWNGNNLGLVAYPVGAIYLSVNSTSPATLFGGTWEQIQGRFLIGCDTTYAAGSTGGSATHTMTTGELPSHNHGGSTGESGAHTHARGTMDITGTACWNMMSKDNSLTSSGAFYRESTRTNERSSSGGSAGAFVLGFKASNSWTGETSESSAHTHTVASQGDATAMNILNPYLAVYMWKRTA